MEYKKVFKRYELKYMVTREQKQRILEKIAPYMTLDGYGRTQIQNIYFDTDDYRLIRRSIEHPTYKEKLRMRCYGEITKGSTLFLELKKKYKHVVYKRRLPLPYKQAQEWLKNIEQLDKSNQIANEIDYFINYYGNLGPKAYLSYEREAYFCKNGDDFRLTFDDNVFFRDYDISFEAGNYGVPLLKSDSVLMELKCSGGIPLWLTSVLSNEKIYKTTFSKYGTGYKTVILPKLKEKKDNA